MSAVTHLYAGVPVANLEASIDWYTRLFGRDPDFRAGDEILWEVAASATLFIEPDAQRAGSGWITVSVIGLDALLASFTARRIDHEAIETYSNGVRHVKVPDPDGNAIAFAEPARCRMSETVIEPFAQAQVSGLTTQAEGAPC